MDTPTAKPQWLADLEDLANSLTHAVGAGFFIAGLALLAVLSGMGRDPWRIVSVCVYGSTLVLLFSASTLYHSARHPALRRALRVADHMSIHFLIAGTYTPFALVTLHGRTGWILFGSVWGLALVGAVRDIFLTGRFKGLSTALYLVMGWMVVAVAGPLHSALPASAFWLLLAGGLAYSLGAVFYLLDKRLPFGHAVWHLFVLGGGICHFLSVTLGVAVSR